MQIHLDRRYKCYGGWVEFYRHESRSTQSEMRFSIFRPATSVKQSMPTIFWLSGLTCTEENVMVKSGVQRILAEKGINFVAMDTSPRGEQVPDDEAWFFGQGAGFYVNATQSPWSQHFKMYDYVLYELPQLLSSHFQGIDLNRKSIMGHSMGGHGALVLSLREPQEYKCVSAFAPICNPSASAWGRHAFEKYLGSDVKLWDQYDACKLLQNANQCLPTLIDQGSEDEFYKEGLLLPESLEKISKANKLPVEVRYQPNYDHSYYFVASFIEDHINFHEKFY